jgi:hypothetical protein
VANRTKKANCLRCILQFDCVADKETTSDCVIVCCLFSASSITWQRVVRAKSCLFIVHVGYLGWRQNVDFENPKKTRKWSNLHWTASEIRKPVTHWRCSAAFLNPFSTGSSSNVFQLQVQSKFASPEFCPEQWSYLCPQCKFRFDAYTRYAYTDVHTRELHQHITFLLLHFPTTKRNLYLVQCCWRYFSLPHS